MLHIRLIRENEGIPRVVFSDEVYNGNPQRKRAFFQIIDGYLGQVAGIVRDGQDSGGIRKDVDPHTIALMILGIIQPGAILWHLSGEKFDVTKHAERAWGILGASIKV